MQQLSEIHVPTGPPPDDIVPSSQAVRDAFVRLGADEVSDDLDFVQGGDGLGKCLKESRRRSPVGRTLAVVVNEVLFLSPQTAAVRFTLRTEKGEFSDMEGRAVRTSDGWTIERATFCALVGRVGVECPPPSART